MPQRARQLEAVDPVVDQLAVPVRVDQERLRGPGCRARGRNHASLRTPPASSQTDSPPTAASCGRRVARAPRGKQDAAAAPTTPRDATAITASEHDGDERKHHTRRTHSTSTARPMRTIGRPSPSPQRRLDAFERLEAERAVERLAGQRGRELEAAEPGRARRPDAGVEQPRADPAPRPVGVDEERADARRLARGVDQRIGLALHLVAAVRACAAGSSRRSRRSPRPPPPRSRCRRR